MLSFLTVHCSSCFSRASESPNAGHSSFRKTSTSAIHFFKVFTSFWGERREIKLLPHLDSSTVFYEPCNPPNLKLHQFGHKLLDSLCVVLQRGSKSFPACHDGIHLSLIPTKMVGYFDLPALDLPYLCIFPVYLTQLVCPKLHTSKYLIFQVQQ